MKYIRTYQNIEKMMRNAPELVSHEVDLWNKKFYVDDCVEVSIAESLSGETLDIYITVDRDLDARLSYKKIRIQEGYNTIEEWDFDRKLSNTKDMVEINKRLREIVKLIKSGEYEPVAPVTKVELKNEQEYKYGVTEGYYPAGVQRFEDPCSDDFTDVVVYDNPVSDGFISAYALTPLNGYFEEADAKKMLENISAILDLNSESVREYKNKNEESVIEYRDDEQTVQLIVRGEYEYVVKIDSHYFSAELLFTDKWSDKEGDIYLDRGFYYSTEAIAVVNEWLECFVAEMKKSDSSVNEVLESQTTLIINQEYNITNLLVVKEPVLLTGGIRMEYQEMLETIGAMMEYSPELVHRYTDEYGDQYCDYEDGNFRIYTVIQDSDKLSIEIFGQEYDIGLYYELYSSWEGWRLVNDWSDVTDLEFIDQALEDFADIAIDLHYRTYGPLIA